MKYILKLGKALLAHLDQKHPNKKTLLETNSFKPNSPQTVWSIAGQVNDRIVVYTRERGVQCRERQKLVISEIEVNGQFSMCQTAIHSLTRLHDRKDQQNQIAFNFYIVVSYLYARIASFFGVYFASMSRAWVELKVL